MEQKKFDLRVFFATVLSIAMPIACQNLLSTTASMVDTIMIGSEGELAVAAVGICSQISSLYFSCYFGFVGGALLFFSQYWGAKNKAGINKTFGITFIFLMIVASIYGGIAVLKPEFLLRIYTDKENIVQVAVPYIRIVGFSYPLLVMGVLISFLMRSTERVKAPLISSILGLIVNFCLNWVLIYGRFGMPKMGPAGAAIGTLASSIVNLIALCIFLKRSDCEVKLEVREMFRWGDGFVKMYLGKCLPIICNEFLYGVGQMIINVVIGRQDESAIAAMAAFRVLEGFVFAFFGGLADASSVVVGREVGAGRHMMGYRYVKGFSMLCPAITFSICMIGVVFSEPLLGLFGLGAEAMYYGKYMILIFTAAGAIRTCNYIMNVCYRAGGDSVTGTVIEIVCLYVVTVPATWIAGMVLKLPFLAIFAFVYTDELIRFVIEIWYTRSCKWVKPVTKAGVEALPEFKKELQEVRAHRGRA